MRDPIQLEFFRRYLTFKEADTPLHFSQAVEDLKKTKEPKVRQQKVNQIIRKFFKNNGWNLFTVQLIRLHYIMIILLYMSFRLDFTF